MWEAYLDANDVTLKENVLSCCSNGENPEIQKKKTGNTNWQM